MSKKDYVTVEQFRNFEVDYGSARCSGCDVYPPRSPAPIIINGKPYCLWCVGASSRHVGAGRRQARITRGRENREFGNWELKKGVPIPKFRRVRAENRGK